MKQKHPYTSWEKGNVEIHNGLFRRFIPKGKNISDYSFEYVARVARWARKDSFTGQLILVIRR